MEILKFKNNDEMPILGLGTWKSKPGEIYTAVRQAIQIGYRHFDCAAIYGNELEIGKAFTDAFKQGDIIRKDIWVTSKLWNNAHARDQVLPALKKTLTDLCLEYLDLYLVHWPVALKTGVVYPGTGSDLVSLADLPLADTWAGMEACFDQGLSNHIGVSNFSIKKLAGLVETAKIKPEMNQIELHPFLQQPEMLTYCRKKNILLTAYSPLGSGDRPAHLKSETEQILLENPNIQQMAQKKGCSAAQILIKWAIDRHTAVIPKSVNPIRLAENFKATQVELNPDEMTAILALDMATRYVRGAIWTPPGSAYTPETLWDESYRIVNGF